MRAALTLLIYVVGVQCPSSLSCRRCFIWARRLQWSWEKPEEP